MITFFVLSVLVILHELGHFLAAKLFGVKVLEFGLGIPPKAMTLATKGETEYTLNWLPLGGFVRLYGEQGELSKLEELNPWVKKRAFSQKPAWQRAIILLAGVVANLVVGIVIFAGIYTYSGIPRQVGEQTVVSKVAPESPAEVAGVEVGDVIFAIGELEIENSSMFVERVNEKRGQAINLYLKKMQGDGTTSNESRVVSVIPRENPPEGQGALGVAVSDLPIIIYDKKPWYTAPFYGAVEGMKESYLWAKMIGQGVFELFVNLISGRVPEGLAGPVGVVRAGSEAASSGMMIYLRFVAIISINLGIFNLLPLPALDGGRLLFLFIEKIAGKRRVAKIEGVVHGVGLLVLVGVLILVTWMDLRG